MTFVNRITATVQIVVCPCICPGSRCALVAEVWPIECRNSHSTGTENWKLKDDCKLTSG